MKSASCDPQAYPSITASAAGPFRVVPQVPCTAAVSARQECMVLLRSDPAREPVQRPDSANITTGINVEIAADQIDRGRHVTYRLLFESFEAPPPCR